MSVVRILTRDTADQMIRAGNTAAWYAKEAKASQAEYFICVAPGAREPFFLGEVERIEAVPESGPDRWALHFRKFARLEPSMLSLRGDGGGQNPFVTLPDPLETYLEVPLSALDWQNVSPDRPDKLKWSFSDRDPPTPNHTLSISEAKEALARSLGIRPDQIEILIRG